MSKQEIGNVNQKPTEELLDGVRHIVGWNLWFSAKMGHSLGEVERRKYLGDQLRSILSESELEISHREAKGIFGGKYKLTYRVAHRGAIQLEFTDLLRDKTDLRTLESVRTYHAGEWEQKVHAVYKKCLQLSNQWNSVSRLIEQLSSVSYTPEEIVALIEVTGDTKETIKLLALSSAWESMCVGLSFAYTVLGRCKEAEFALETLVSIYPENALCHLALGNLFLGALINSNPPPRDSISQFRRTIETTGEAGEEWLNALKQSDPSSYRALTDREYELRSKETMDMLSRVTLEALGCSYDYAYKKAEESFREAMRLSKDRKNSGQAWQAMATLKTVHKAE